MHSKPRGRADRTAPVGLRGQRRPARNGHNGSVFTVSFPGLPFTLVAEGTPSCAVEREGDAVVLTSGPRSDLFMDPAGDGTGPDAGRFLGKPPAATSHLRDGS